MIPDPGLRAIGTIYHELVSDRPELQAAIADLFKAEVEGLAVQTNPNLDRDSYYRMALRKGSATQLVLPVLAQEASATAVAYDIGAVTQLIDDCLDIKEDQAVGISTIATYDLAHDGTLDRLWLDILTRIASLPPQFNIYRTVLATFTVYVPERNPTYFGPEVRALAQQYNLFEFQHGCDVTAVIAQGVLRRLG
jgi:hypothetical protein